jgi:hypothetical protein
VSTVVDAPFDAYLDTPNKSIRQAVARRGVCLHHAATTSYSGLERLVMGAKQVSATAIAKDRDSKRLMTDGFRPWSMSSAWGDSAFRSVETCNESSDGWTVSDASHWELAHLVAYWAELDGFWPHRSGDPKTWTVVGHREMYTIHGVSYATSCPGSMDLDLIVARAQQILRGLAGLGHSILSEGTSTMYAIRLTDTKDVFYVAPEYIRHEKYAPSGDLVRNILTTDDKYHDIERASFPAVLAAFGIPQNVPGIIKDGPVDVWSRAREAHDDTTELLKRLGAIEAAIQAPPAS